MIMLTWSDIILQPHTVVLVCVLGCLGWLVWRSAMPAHGTPRTPSCGACARPVLAGQNLTCLHCRADLTRAGIVTLRMQMRRRGGMATMIGAWTTFWITTGVTCLTLLLVNFEDVWLSGGVRIVTTLKVVSRLTTPTGAFGPSTITTEFISGNIPSPRQLTSVVELTGPGGKTSRVVIDGYLKPTYTFPGSDGSVVTSRMFSPGDARAVMQAIGGQPPGEDGVELDGEFSRFVICAGVTLPSVASPWVGRSIQVVAGTPTLATTFTPIRAAEEAHADRIGLACLALWLPTGPWIASLLWRRRRSLLKERQPVAGAAPVIPK